MEERVRWQDPVLRARGIDQTRLVLDMDDVDNPEFSFLVVGDSGSGVHRGQNPQRQVAEHMLSHKQECQFLLHTGDVIYLVGASDYYPKNFIEPYREYLVNGHQHQRVPYDQMVFNLPFLPVPGNHDYYDLPLFYGLVLQALTPLNRLLEGHLDLDVGWQGSVQGKAYAKAFLDYLLAYPPHTHGEHGLAAHLDRHYTAQTDTGRCLHYQPGQFTRLPNRYYTFRVGGIDFFALDSNTFNAPAPLPNTREGFAFRRILEDQRRELEEKKIAILEASKQQDPTLNDETDEVDDLRTQLTQIEEMKLDIDKQLAANETTVTDVEQLEWLKERLIASWNDPQVRGRVLYFHHPPYVTEATKWYQGQTLAVRQRLRRVLDAVAASVGEAAQGRAIVDLVLNGHAHCFEYLQTLETGHADAHVHWVVCGGSGFSLRRQRPEGPELVETLTDTSPQTRPVAKSHLYLGRNGYGFQKRRPYSFVRIDVKAGTPPKFVLRPCVSERFQQKWSNYCVKPFCL